MKAKKKKLMAIENADPSKMDIDDLIHFATTLVAVLAKARNELHRRKDAYDAKEKEESQFVVEYPPIN